MKRHLPRPLVLGKLLLAATLCLLSNAARATEQQEIGAIRATVENFVRQHTAGLPGQTIATVGIIDPRLRLAKCQAAEVFLPVGGRLWGNATVGVRCPSANPWTIYVPVNVRIMAEVVVAARPLSAGQSVNAADVLLQESDLSQLPSGVMLDAEQVIGRTLVSSAGQGQAFRPEMLRTPQAIQQGQAVQIVAKGSGFRVSSEGRALTGAKPGQTVSVRTHSGQIIQGIAQQNGVVEVNF